MRATLTPQVPGNGDLGSDLVIFPVRGHIPYMIHGPIHDGCQIATRPPIEALAPHCGRDWQSPAGQGPGETSMTREVDAAYKALASPHCVCSQAQGTLGFSIPPFS
jgi:hypothetical protein